MPPRSQEQASTLKKARWQSGYAADCKSVDLGSTPGGASILFFFLFRQRDEQKNDNAILAQLVERNLAKVEVIGSNPMYRSKFCNVDWRQH